MRVDTDPSVTSRARQPENNPRHLFGFFTKLRGQLRNSRSPCAP